MVSLFGGEGEIWSSTTFAVPEIALLAAASRNFDRCTLVSVAPPATGGAPSLVSLAGPRRSVKSFYAK